MNKFFEEKRIIGMIHLKNIASQELNQERIEEIYKFAKKDLNALENGGADAALIENFFDNPYSLELNVEQVIAFVSIFSRLKAISKIPLGVNLQQTNGKEEIVIANLCGGTFMRSESFVETRVGPSGIMEPQASKLIRYKNDFAPHVQIYADIDVKHSHGLISKDLTETFNEAVENEADAIIITAESTGKNPDIKEIKLLKDNTETRVPVIIGSGVNKDNISSYFEIAAGVIVGSSIKEKEIFTNIDERKVQELVNAKEQSK
ncbi:BtpA/SgcQ family protein [Carnobacteriaceae bacterium 52-44]